MVSGGINMFGHNTFDNYSLPFRSDEECNYDKSEFTDWSSCGSVDWSDYGQIRTQTFRNKGTPDECYANLEDLVKSRVTSMKDAGSDAHYYSFPEDDSGNAGFTIEDRRVCTPGSVETTNDYAHSMYDCKTGIEYIANTEEEHNDYADLDYVHDMNECEVTGCMRVDAINYNPDATEDDGSCEYSTRSMFTNSSPEPAMVKTEDPLIETTSKTPYLSIIAFLAASGVLGNGVNHHYQITDRIKSYIAKYK